MDMRGNLIRDAIANTEELTEESVRILRHAVIAA